MDYWLRVGKFVNIINFHCCIGFRTWCKLGCQSWKFPELKKQTKEYPLSPTHPGIWTNRSKVKTVQSDLCTQIHCHLPSEKILLYWSNEPCIRSKFTSLFGLHPNERCVWNDIVVVGMISTIYNNITCVYRKTITHWWRKRLKSEVKCVADKKCISTEDKCS